MHATTSIGANSRMPRRRIEEQKPVTSSSAARVDNIETRATGNSWLDYLLSRKTKPDMQGQLVGYLTSAAMLSL